VTLKHGEDREVLAAYGKALAANGSFEEALKIVRRAQTPDRPDWRLMSAEAAILDQTGQSQAARGLYQQALDLAPNEPIILSNYAMSYVVTGELAEAEKLLRRAIAVPSADARVRQNLALVVGLQGRFKDAEKIAAADLPPDQAEANIAYLRNMLSQPDNWKKLESSSDVPTTPQKIGPKA
jgi:Flp pilus assembly protein TadD